MSLEGQVTTPHADAIPAAAVDGNYSPAASSVTFSAGHCNHSTLTEHLGNGAAKFVPCVGLPGRRKLKTSPVWQYFEHFDLAYHPDKKFHRLCLICRTKGIDTAISVGQKCTPGPLINHLRTHKEQYAEYLEKKATKEAEASSAAIVPSQRSITSFISSVSSTKDCFKRKYAQWVVEATMPLCVGENIAFRNMIRAANASVQVPDRKALKNILDAKKTQTMGKLKSFLNDKYFSITCDHWTSLAQENFGALTIHLIDNIELKAFVLSCMHHPNGTTAAEVEAQFIHDLVSWGLQKRHLVAVVTDTASNMNAFGVSVASWPGASFLRHHYCADHVLQLTAVKAFSGDVVVTTDDDEDTSLLSVKKARALVNYFHSSCIATDKLNRAQKALKSDSVPLKLLQDVKTRWWSTYTLIERMLQLREALENVFEDEFRFRESQNTITNLEKLKLTESDFESLKNIEFVLRPFKAAQKALEGEKYVHLSLLPLLITEIRKQMGICEGLIDQVRQKDLYELLCNMADDFNDRWGESLKYSNDVVRGNRQRQIGVPTYAFWASALDPRTKKKLLKLLSDEDQARLWMDLIQAVRLVAGGQQLHEMEVIPQQQQQHERCEERNRSDSNQQNILWNFDDEDDSSSNGNQLSFDEILDAEFKTYRAERGQKMFSAEGVHSNPLDWWQLHLQKFPNIWKLAACILAIPATSAPSERVFSMAANIVNKKRVRLKPENVDLLIFLRGNKNYVDWD